MGRAGVATRGWDVGQAFVEISHFSLLLGWLSSATSQDLCGLSFPFWELGHLWALAPVSLPGSLSNQRGDMVDGLSNQ